MNFFELQSFVTVCDCRSFSEAARRLHTTRATLQRRVRALEKEFDLVLFVREGGEVKVTQTGRSLYQDAARLLEQRREFFAKAHRFQRLNPLPQKAS